MWRREKHGVKVGFHVGVGCAVGWLAGCLCWLPRPKAVVAVVSCCDIVDVGHLPPLLTPESRTFQLHPESPQGSSPELNCTQENGSWCGPWMLPRGQEGLCPPQFCHWTLQIRSGGLNSQEQQFRLCWSTIYFLIVVFIMEIRDFKCAVVFFQFFFFFNPFRTQCSAPRSQEQPPWMRQEAPSGKMGQLKIMNVSFFKLESNLRCERTNTDRLSLNLGFLRSFIIKIR